MPAVYEWNTALDLTVGRFDGDVTAEEIAVAIMDAIDRGAYPVGADKLTLIPSSARLHRLDLDGLRRIQRIVEAHERGAREAAGEPSYRSVLVCADRLKRPIMTLYSMVWTMSGHRGVAYNVTDNTASALAWLGRPPEAWPMLGLDAKPPGERS
jgi:hypothetical protein